MASSSRSLNSLSKTSLVDVSFRQKHHENKAFLAKLVEKSYFLCFWMNFKIWHLCYKLISDYRNCTIDQLLQYFYTTWSFSNLKIGQNLISKSKVATNTQKKFSFSENFLTLCQNVQKTSQKRPPDWSKIFWTKKVANLMFLLYNAFFSLPTPPGSWTLSGFLFLLFLAIFRISFLLAFLKLTYSNVQIYKNH